VVTNTETRVATQTVTNSDGAFTVGRSIALGAAHHLFVHAERQFRHIRIMPRN
jgi:hypothetical protein